jgi:hypothetical protein
MWAGWNMFQIVDHAMEEAARVTGQLLKTFERVLLI